MGMNKYLHVTFTFRGGVKAKELEAVFDQARDWVRYATNCWIIFTNEEPIIWSNRLRKYIDQNDSVLVSEFSITNYNGWMTQLVRDWLTKKRV
jgi:hypothetical protein